MTYVPLILKSPWKIHNEYKLNLEKALFTFFHLLLLSLAAAKVIKDLFFSILCEHMQSELPIHHPVLAFYIVFSMIKAYTFAATA